MFHRKRKKRTIPPNATLNGQKSSEICSIFALGLSLHCQLTARIDGIDRDFLFGNARFPSSRLGCSPFPSRLGTLQVSRALALIHTNYYVMYLGSGTNFRSPSISTDTLTSWVG
jgi:hypothetical protein